MLLLLSGEATTRAASPVAGDDSNSTTANTPITVTAPGVLANDTDADMDTLTVSGSVAGQPYSFAGVTFDQTGTPDTYADLPVGAIPNGNGAVITAEPTGVTGAVGFPTSSAGFQGNLSIGRLFAGSATTTPTALNLPAGNDGSAARSGFVLSWSGGLLLTNETGLNEFVIYESGSLGVPEAFMVQVHDMDTDTWSPWVYRTPASFQDYVGGGGGAFATVFDLDTFSVPAGNKVDMIRVVNMRPSDRMAVETRNDGINSFGEGVVIPEDNGATSAIVPDPGTSADFTTYGNSTFDPDILYVGMLRTLIPGMSAYDPISANGASVIVNPDGSYMYDPSGAAFFQSLAAGAVVNDTFNYTVTDGNNNFDTGTVTVAVTGVNDPPVGNADSNRASEDRALSIPAPGVLANDTDPDSADTLMVTTFDAASTQGAAVSVSSTGQYTYDPTGSAILQGLPLGAVTNDTFTYTLSDGTASVVVTVTITVLGVNDAPAPGAEVFATSEDAPLTAPAPGLLAGDTDADTDDTLSVSAIGPQMYTFASQTFDQRGTPNLLTVLQPGTLDGGAIVTSIPIGTTAGVNFPLDPTGFLGALGMGRLFAGTNAETTPSALNLPADNNGTSARSGVELSWANGLMLTNLAGADFVVFESGSEPTPEGFMVQARNAATTTWSSWFYFQAQTFETFVGAVSEGAFATTFDLSSMGFAANDRVDRIRVVNLTSADRMVSGTGVGQVIPEDGGGTSSTLPAPGAFANFAIYGAASLDPDPLYIGILHTLVPAQAAFATTSTLGATVTVNADGSFTYDPGGSATLNALAQGAMTVDTFSYTVIDAHGGFATGTASVTVTGVNDAPSVSITSPADNSTFVSTPSITIDATASDPDDGVMQVEFFADATSLGVDATPPYSVDWVSPPGGTYTLTAVATDFAGASTTSAGVTVHVLNAPPITLLSAGSFSSSSFFQSGLLWQTIRITNPTATTLSAVRVTIQLSPAEITAGIRVYNATGTNGSSEPYVDYVVPIPAAGTADLTIEFYVPDRTTLPAPTYVSEVIATPAPFTPAGTPQSTLRTPIALADGSMLLDFSTQAGATYYIQYSPDMVTWTTALPSVTGTGSIVQWIDNGPPKTTSHPSTVVTRFYRLILAP